MKQLTLIKIALLGMASLMLSCNDDYMVAVDASFSLSFDPDTEYAYAAEAFYVTKTGSGEFITLYTGAARSVYGTADNTGTDFETNDSLSVTYSTPGTYTMTVVASSNGSFGKERETVIQQKTITVLDRRTQLTELRIQDPNNATATISASIVGNLITLTILDNIVDLNIATYFTLSSSYATLSIDGAVINYGDKVDYSQAPLTLKVTAANGDERLYTLRVQEIATSDEKELLSFRANTGETGVISHDPATVTIELEVSSRVDPLLTITSSAGSTVYFIRETPAGVTDTVQYSNRTRQYLLESGNNPVVKQILVVAENLSERTYELLASKKE